MRGELARRARSSQEIRKSLDATLRQIEGDLTTLGDRFAETVRPIHQLGRHPVLLAVAGAVLGVVLVRRPALVLRGVGQLAKWGAPILLSAFLRSAVTAGKLGPADSHVPAP